MSSNLDFEVHTSSKVTPPLPTIIDPAEDAEISEFLTAHHDISHAVLQGGGGNGRQNDVEWKIKKGELIIRYTTASGVLIETRQEIGIYSFRWKKLKPYIIITAVAVAVIIAVAYPHILLDAFRETIIKLTIFN